MKTSPETLYDHSDTWAEFLESLGCVVRTKGSAVIGTDGEAYFDAWVIVPSERSKTELSEITAWQMALKSIASAVHEEAAE